MQKDPLEIRHMLSFHEMGTFSMHDIEYDTRKLPAEVQGRHLQPDNEEEEGDEEEDEEGEEGEGEEEADVIFDEAQFDDLEDDDEEEVA